jgi:hypothetical protein
VLAAATGRIGYVYFVDGQPTHWGLSHKGASSPLLAAAQTAKWISLFVPEVVITEQVGERSRKGALTKYLIAAMADEARGSGCFVVSVPRVQVYANKYDEASQLVRRFPMLSAWLPKRPRIWQSEPRNMVLFEAVALALSFIDGEGV